MLHQIPAAAERRTVVCAPRPAYRQWPAEASAVTYVRLALHASFGVPHFMIPSKSVELQHSIAIGRIWNRRQHLAQLRIRSWDRGARSVFEVGSRARSQ